MSGERERFVDMLPEVFDCNPTQEECIFSRCHKWGRCVNLNNAILADRKRILCEVEEKLKDIHDNYTLNEWVKPKVEVLLAEIQEHMKE